jgi:hypothetical protein
VLRARTCLMPSVCPPPVVMSRIMHANRCSLAAGRTPCDSSPSSDSPVTCTRTRDAEALRR